MKWSHGWGEGIVYMKGSHGLGEGIVYMKWSHGGDIVHDFLLTHPKLDYSS